MKTEREVLQMALEALGEYESLIEHQYTGTRDAMSDLQNADNAGQLAIAAIKEVLARPEKPSIVMTRTTTEELVAITEQDEDGKILNVIWKKPEQESVAVRNERIRLGKLIHYPSCWDTACYRTLEDALTEIGCSIHLKPAREWHGLTTAEAEACWSRGGSLTAFWKEIEAKLKEKNHD